ncbi:GNAT family N-acetyltransferase [Dyella sp. GSA-30]|uniref:GNAT family N-acetyltransferase n=1 Tax=Dyella sp. GSA-30 TaxID=2994496 RepID=UPI00249388C2|nr:GNAT family N-acetyltransferase [Dyella sp. GSA-30]BDU20604.1 N-acetyltransferase [Dyella sp. GSA-30]
MNTRIRQATVDDLHDIVPLFDAYRQFYGQPADLSRAHAFLSERFTRNESVILVAMDGSRFVGFTQLYPLFSSVRTVRTYLLNDLFVAADARRHGVAAALLHAAAEHARAIGAASLSLSTAHDNMPAQRLYESLGWKRDEHFREYSLSLKEP